MLRIDRALRAVALENKTYSVKTALTRVCTLWNITSVFLLMNACGGRVARPVEEVNNFDDLLSCDHLVSEYQVNLEKIEDISGERIDKTDHNVGWILFMPLFLDLSGSEKREIEALSSRNQRLVDLAEEKNCEDLTPIAIKQPDS